MSTDCQTPPSGDLSRLVMTLGNLRALCISRLGVSPLGYSIHAMKRDALRLAIGEETDERSDAYVDGRFASVLDSMAMAAPALDGTVVH